jgi:flavin reductase (DIM6/NTAB) family NADH-FMN oxidoreductase RutF
MSVDSREFRKALGNFATGVAVVTILAEEGRPAGVTINAFTSVSLDPPLVAFCLGRSSALFDAFVKGDSFVVNILTAEQEGLSNHFASRQYQRDWNEIETTPSSVGAPALTGAATVIECRRESVLDGGDHVIMLGRVVALSCNDDTAPLLYFRGRYAALANG